MDNIAVLNDTLNIAQKGYSVTNDFVTENCVSINGNKVETDRLSVTFDDAWQVVSIYDKKAERELIKSGAVANELRIHADYLCHRAVNAPEIAA